MLSKPVFIITALASALALALLLFFYGSNVKEGLATSIRLFAPPPKTSDGPITALSNKVDKPTPSAPPPPVAPRPPPPPGSILNSLDAETVTDTIKSSTGSGTGAAGSAGTGAFYGAGTGAFYGAGTGAFYGAGSGAGSGSGAAGTDTDDAETGRGSDFDYSRMSVPE